MVAIPNVRLSLSNSPESVPVVQQALAGVAASLGLDALETNDLDTAVTEVCNNVVHHAYEGQEGPLEVELYALAGALDVVVRDRGIGIRPHVGERSQPHTGLGMPIVHALTQRIAFSKLAGGGTEVRMQFTTPSAAALEPLEEGELESHVIGEAELASTIEMALAPSSVARAVLPRVLGALAQRARFSSEQIADVRRFSETLAANAGDAIGAGHLGVAVELAPRDLGLRIGPLRAGSATRLLDASTDGLGPTIELRAGDARVVSSGSAEMLALRLLERR
jgi:serine/threonine-protein kinase RsbW